MNIESESLDGGILKIILSGRMDVQGAQQIDLKFTASTSGQRAVIVDMSAVDFLASIGMRTLLLSAKAMSKRGGKMALLGPDATVVTVMCDTGMKYLSKR